MPKLQGQSGQLRLPLQAVERQRLRRLLRQRHGSAELLVKMMMMPFRGYMQ
jgi:hypothetical protein